MRADWALPRLHFSRRYRLADPTPAGVAFIAQHLRQGDREEIHAAAGTRDYEAMLRMSLQVSDSALMAVSNDDTPVALMGVSTTSLLSNIGCPWMLATDEASRHRSSLVRGGRAYSAAMLQQYNRLENWVDARNAHAVAWLRHSGYVLEEPAPYGALQMPFHRFWMEK